MQMIRTIVWMLVSGVLVAFIAMNWSSAPVNFWPMDLGYLHFDWPVGVIALVFFLLGLLPTWLLAKVAGWRLRRRIGTLEDTVRSVTATPFNPAPPADAAPSGNDEPPFVQSQS